jgi:hypothetical protein
MLKEIHNKQNLDQIKLTLFHKQNKRCYYTHALIKEENLANKTYIDFEEDKNSKEQKMFLVIKYVRELTTATGPILSREQNFFFCHIPKNGGRSLRIFLKPIDEQYFKEEKRKMYYSRLIDINHLPLFFIEKELPVLYEFIENADSYAILRNPFERFASSLAQRIKMYRNAEIGNLTAAEVSNEIEATIKYLKRNIAAYSYLDYEFIHFQRQIDYVHNNGRQIIKNLFLMDEIENLIKDLQQKYPTCRLKYDPKQKRIGATQVPKNRIGAILMNIYGKSILSQVAPKGIVNWFKNIFMLDFRKTEAYNLFLTKEVKSFINEYYADDIKLYNKIVKNKRGI